MRYTLATRNNPFQLFDEIEKEMGRVFGDNRVTSNESVFTPKAHYQEDDNHYLLSFDIPGIPKEEISIEADEGILTISGERKNHFEGKGYSERSYGRFERKFSIPKDVDTSKIEAHFEHGVLNLALPKVAKASPQKISIGNENQGFWSRLIGQNQKGSE